MAGEDALKVEGVVVEALPDSTYRVELANRHCVRAFVAGRAKLTFARLVVGDKVTLQMSPFDLSRGRIIAEKQ